MQEQENKKFDKAIVNIKTKQNQRKTNKKSPEII